MESKITGVSELVDVLSDDPEGPGKRTMPEDGMYGMKEPSWGPQASLESQDAGSRLGIDMGGPTVKSAALRYAMLCDVDASLEKVAILSFLAKGAVRGAKLLVGAGKGGVAAAKGAGQLVAKGGSGASRFGVARRAAASEGRVARRAAKGEARVARRTAQAKKVEGMAPGKRQMSNLGFAAKENAKAVGGGTLAVGGTAWTAADSYGSMRGLRNARSGVSGYG